MVFVVKDIILYFRKIKTILILISYKRFFSHPEKLRLNLTRMSYCNSGPRPPDKIAYSKISFLISRPKHMLWVLKRTVSMRRFF